MDIIFQIQPINVFENTVQEIFDNLLNKVPSSKTSSLDPDVLEKVQKEVKQLILDCYFDIHEVTAKCHSKGWPNEKIKHFINLLEISKSELLYESLNNCYSTFGETIVNFDWILKLVLGTSELKTYKYPLLQLALSTVKKNKKCNKVMYDINKSMLLKIIMEIENIQ